MTPIPSGEPWRGCYDHGWNKNDLVAEAFSHPAKLAKGLGFRIIEHAITNGWIKAGDTCVDPFGGVATGALALMLHGVNYVGCELEPRFVALGQQNIELWRRKYGSKAGFGSARILQGDSRRLSEIIAGADLVCSSPPYANGGTHQKDSDIDLHERPDCPGPHWRSNKAGGRLGISQSTGYGQSPGQLGAMKEGEPPRVDCVVSSPPYASKTVHGGHGFSAEGFANPKRHGKTSQTFGEREMDVYGDTEGQLGSLSEGKFSAVVSSPPYAAIAAGAGGLNTKPGKDGQQSGRNPDSASQGADQHYGESAGQLSAMVEGDVAAVISSPPYEGSMDSIENSGARSARTNGFKCGQKNLRYGQNPNTFLSRDPSGLNNEQRHEIAIKNPQVGALEGDTFWQAARDIVAQCHAILRPGGHCIWITKRFVRKGKIVEFSDQWQALCEAQGFRLACRHRAMLVAHYGEQDGLWGESKILETRRISFFRRLAEKNGSPKIEWEDVICMEKPNLT